MDQGPSGNVFALNHQLDKSFPVWCWNMGQVFQETGALMMNSRANSPIPIMSFSKIHIKSSQQCCPRDAMEENSLKTQALQFEWQHLQHYGLWNIRVFAKFGIRKFNEGKKGYEGKWSYLQHFLNNKKVPSAKTPSKITPHHLHAYSNHIWHSSEWWTNFAL